MSKLEEWRKAQGISYYNLGLKLGYKGINPAANTARICLTGSNKYWRFPKPSILKKIRDLTNKSVSYEDLVNDYLQAKK